MINWLSIQLCLGLHSERVGEKKRKTIVDFTGVYSYLNNHVISVYLILTLNGIP